MKSAGDYALMHANGMKWVDVVDAIRKEWAEAWGMPDAAPGTTDYTLTKEKNDEVQGIDNGRECDGACSDPDRCACR